MQSLISSLDLRRHEIEALMDTARSFRDNPYSKCFAGSVIGLFFYSDSLRTRVGFETAAARLGIRSFLVTEPRFTPVMSRPESVEDAVRSVAGWSNALLIRHADDGLVQRITQLVDVPVINCGNGTDEHPTQALVDIFSIGDIFGQVDGISLGLIGDLKGMRSAHSLIRTLSRYNDIYVRCISPAGLELPDRYSFDFTSAGNRIEVSNIPNFANLDIVYVAGLPRHTASDTVDSVRPKFSITAETMDNLDPKTRILCPLPRIDEIHPDVNSAPQAAYFEQSYHALAVRQSILIAILNGKLLIES